MAPSLPFLQIIDGDAWYLPLYTRMPFRYGIATVTELPHAFVRVRLQVNGTAWTGVAADHLAPKWFTKNPATSPAEDIAEMRRVILHVLDLARGLQAETPWALWRQLYDAQAAWGKAEGLAPLLTNFGVSLVERAVLDAFCRAQGKPFHTLLHSDALGVDLGSVHEELEGQTPANLLPSGPLPRILARHTVGLSDPLTDATIPDSDCIKDGLPQSLEACIRTYGLRHFKLKVGGDATSDVARLGKIVSVLAATVPANDWAFSIDGNESYKTLDAFRAFWEAVQAHPVLRDALAANRLLFVEQPLHRDIALSDEAGSAFTAWPNRPPILIDESDADLGSLPRALSLGYVGTSHKNCKGIFKGIANACLLAHRRKTWPELPAMLSGEDLSNVGPVALNQDLAVQATLGIESVERNGHHYFRGLSVFPADVQEAALAAHPDLYRRADDPAPYPTLAITDGHITLDTANAAPFGVAFSFDPSAYNKL